MQAMLATVMEDLNRAIVSQSCEKMLMDSYKICHSFKLIFVLATYVTICDKICNLATTTKKALEKRQCQLSPFGGCLPVVPKRDAMSHGMGSLTHGIIIITIITIITIINIITIITIITMVIFLMIPMQ